MEKGWGEDEMALSASQNSAMLQKKGTNPRQTPRFRGRCCHCCKWGIRKNIAENKLTKEQQEQADKEKSEEQPRKYLQYVKCYNCNKMGDLLKDCPEKFSRDSSGGSSGGFTTMCVEGGQSPVEEDPETTVEEDKEELNLDMTLEAGSEEKDSEQHLEQGLLLQDWINI